ncbi:hypothetical protein L2E82_50002 [Cichorium intybus]|nr:hypothetical protein L2E82_50002 [Cichorium intybus]
MDQNFFLLVFNFLQDTQLSPVTTKVFIFMDLRIEMTLRAPGFNGSEMARMSATSLAGYLCYPYDSVLLLLYFWRVEQNRIDLG